MKSSSHKLDSLHARPRPAVAAAVWLFVAIAFSPGPLDAQVSRIEERLKAEAELIAAARAASRAGNDATAASLLVSQTGLASQKTPGVLLAQRAMAVCGWLNSDNEYGQAMKLARRVLPQLAAMREENPADQVDRLYWEAMLLADILDDKPAALARLEEAGKLAPADDRILQCAEQLARALAEFGR